MNRIFTLIFSFLSLTLLAQDAFERTFQVGTADEIAYDALEWNNGYLMAGYYKSGVNYKSYIAEVNGSGTITNTHTYGTSNDNGIYDMIKTSTGDIVACGYTTSGAKYDFMVLRIKPNFTQQWENTFVDQSFSWEEQTNMGITELKDGHFEKAAHFFTKIELLKNKYF